MNEKALKENGKVLNALSIDVEEYFQVANFDQVIGVRNWNSHQSRVMASTTKCLELLGETNTKATFFILGWIAKRHPELVKQIHSAGHEIASHGYLHRSVTKMEPASFFRDISVTKQVLESIIGQAVIGYRAPNFSISIDSRWPYEALVRAGYTYDSSVHPIRHPNYASPKGPSLPYVWENKLVVCPISISAWKLGPFTLKLPFAGGAYWRLFPESYIHYNINRTNNSAQPCCCYFHPWEVDHLQPRIAGISKVRELRHYGGLKKFEAKLRNLLLLHRFAPISRVYNPIEMLVRL